jgi:hypothetical protein
MREMLFRAKEKDDGEWVYGWYCRYPFGKWPLKDAIIPSEEAENGYHRFVEVDPATVGQYTGLTDKYGKNIFEGDVVAYPEYGNLAVVWDDGAFQFMREDTFYDMLDHYTNGFAVVIGNIHDNPELLEGGGEDG